MKYEKRHTCIICKRKRNESRMINVFSNSWACEKYKHLGNCYCHSDIYIMKKIISLESELKILNLSAMSRVFVTPERTKSQDGDIFVPDFPDDEIFNPYDKGGF